METDFVEDLVSLCNLQVASFTEAAEVLGLLCDLISEDIAKISAGDQSQCSSGFINSNAYQSDVEKSRQLLVEWLIDTDKLQTSRMQLIGLLLSADMQSMAPMLNRSQNAVQALVDTIWIYRFTNHALMTSFLGILYHVCAVAEFPSDILESCFTSDLVNFLFRQIRDHEYTNETLIILVALNDQYMLHDKRDSNNKVFSVLERSPNEYIGIVSALVWLFNRCKETDQNLKIFICKFFYLKFTSPVTADLLYTNDLIVLSEVLVRELDDLPLEAVDVRAMYLRVLYALLKHSTIEVSHPKLRTTLVEVLLQTVECADNLKGDEDRLEILRLAKRCLNIPWLQHQAAEVPQEQIFELNEANSSNEINDQNESNETDESPYRNQGSNNTNNNGVKFSPSYLERRGARGDSDNDSVSTNASIVNVNLMKPNPRKVPCPPPPPVSRRHFSLASTVSTDSGLSLDAIDHFRPPPPPPRGKRPFRHDNPFFGSS